MYRAMSRFQPTIAANSFTEIPLDDIGSLINSFFVIFNTDSSEKLYVDINNTGDAVLTISPEEVNMIETENTIKLKWESTEKPVEIWIFGEEQLSSSSST